MPASCCAPYERVADQQFNEKKVAAEVKRYRKKGPGSTTRLLEDGISKTGDLDGTLLDLGAGAGSLTFGLLKRGVVRAIAVDASSAYIDAARREAERIGRADDVQFVHADFVSAAAEIPTAAIVALDRVVCCYPSYEPLLNLALERASRCLALSYPRDVWYVHLGNLIENGQRRLKHSSFRTVIHPALNMEQTIRHAGFSLFSRRKTWTWSVDVYTR